MKKLLSMGLLLAMLLTLVTACGGKNGEEPSGSAPASAEEDQSAEAALAAERLAAYQTAMESFLSDHIFPNGIDCEYDETFGDFSQNKFAICDVDSDGEDELIVSFITAPMVGMVEMVYRYDAATKTLVSELNEYPALTYYDNAIVQAEWSHNQGLAGENFWPYSLFTYDDTAMSYTMLASVDGWDKSLSDTDYSGNSFPDDIDADGDGLVYVVNDMEGNENTMDQADYDDWRAQILDAALEISVPYQDITEENIAAIA